MSFCINYFVSIREKEYIIQNIKLRQNPLKLDKNINVLACISLEYLAIRILILKIKFNENVNIDVLVSISLNKFQIQWKSACLF